MELKKVRSTDGLEHGLINTVGNSVQDDGFKNFAENVREEMKKKKKESERIVKAQYLNKNGEKERLERPYMMWAGQPITMWRFLHGEIYDVPKGLVDDVNSEYKRPPKRSGLMGPNGKELEMDVRQDPEHRFVPIGF